MSLEAHPDLRQMYNDGIDLSGPEGNNQPSPSDFMTFLPWACKRFTVDVTLEMIKAELTDDSKKKGGPRSELENNAAHKKFSPTKRGNSQFSTQYGPNLIDQSNAAKKSVPSNLLQLVATYLNNVLVHLKFEKARHISAEVFSVITQFVRFHPHLYGITISSGLSALVVYEIGRMLPLSQITEIVFDGCELKEANYDILLATNHRLKLLSLARCRMGDVAAIKLISKIDCADELLQVLNLSTNHLTDKFAAHMGTLLRSNRSIKYLNLTGNMITCAGAIAILTPLKSFPLSMEEVLRFKAEYMAFIKKNLVFEVASETNLERSAGKKKSTSRVPKGSKKKPDDDFDKKRDNFNKNIKFDVDFQHPFSDNTKINNWIYCNGNNSLAYLNFSFNNLSFQVLEFILEVLNEQRALNRNPVGLMRIKLDGNPLIPFFSHEFEQIQKLLGSTIDKQQSQKKGKK